MPGGLVSFQAPFRPVASSLPQNFRPVAPGIQGVAPQPGNPAPRMPSFGGGGGSGITPTYSTSGPYNPNFDRSGGAQQQMYNAQYAAANPGAPSPYSMRDPSRQIAGPAGTPGAPDYRPPAPAGGGAAAGGFQVPQGIDALIAPILAQLERDRAGINESSLERGLYTSDVPEAQSRLAEEGAMRQIWALLYQAQQAERDRQFSASQGAANRQAEAANQARQMQFSAQQADLNRTFQQGPGAGGGMPGIGNIVSGGGGGGGGGIGNAANYTPQDVSMAVSQAQSALANPNLSPADRDAIEAELARIQAIQQNPAPSFGPNVYWGSNQNPAPVQQANAQSGMPEFGSMSPEQQAAFNAYWFGTSGQTQQAPAQAPAQVGMPQLAQPGETRLPDQVPWNLA